MSKNAVEILIRAKDSASGVLKKTKGELKDFAIAATAVTGAGLALGGSLLAMAKKAANVGDELAKASQRTGVATKELAGLKFAAEQADSSLEDVVQALRRISGLAFDAASGTASARESFDRLGVSFQNSDGTLRATNDMLADISDRFAGMEDGAAKTAMAVDIFGRRGTQMIPMLNAGGASLKAATAQMTAFGLALDDADAKLGEEFNDTVDQAQMAVAGLAVTIGIQLLPRLTEAAKFFRDTGIAVKDFAKEFPRLTDYTFNLSLALVGTGGLVLALTATKIALAGVAVAAGTTAGALTGMIAAVAAVIAAVVTFRNEIASHMTTAASTVVSVLSKIVRAAADAASAIGFMDANVAKLRELQFSLEQTSLNLDETAKSFLEESGAVIGNTAAVDAWLNKNSEVAPVIEDQSAKAKTLIERLFGVKTAYEALRDAQEDQQELMRSGEGLGIPEYLREPGDPNRGFTAPTLGITREATQKAMRLAQESVDFERDLRAQAIEFLADAQANSHARLLSEQKSAAVEMVRSIRDSAGRVFDDMFIRGQNVLQSLANMAEGLLNTITRTAFQGIAQAVLTGKGGSGGLLGLAGGLPGIGKLGGLLGLGGGAAIAAGGTALAAPAVGSLAAISGATGIGMAGAGVGAVSFGGAGAGGAGGMAALFSNPWTAVAAGGILGGLAIWKALRGRTQEAQFTRDPFERTSERTMEFYAAHEFVDRFARAVDKFDRKITTMPAKHVVTTGMADAMNDNTFRRQTGGMLMDDDI